MSYFSFRAIDQRGDIYSGVTKSEAELSNIIKSHSLDILNITEITSDEYNAEIRIQKYSSRINNINRPQSIAKLPYRRSFLQKIWEFFFKK